MVSHSGQPRFWNSPSAMDQPSTPVVLKWKGPIWVIPTVPTGVSTALSEKKDGSASAPYFPQ